MSLPECGRPKERLLAYPTPRKGTGTAAATLWEANRISKIVHCKQDVQTEAVLHHNQELHMTSRKLLS